MPPTVTIHQSTNLPADDLASIGRWLDVMFDPDHHGEFETNIYFLRVWEDGEWVSLVVITDHTITAGGQPVHIGGIGGVSTREDRRERGYASMALREAARFMFEELGVEFGMLFCDPHRIPFYASLGWQVIDERFRFVANDGGEAWEQRFMILPPDALTVWPAGEVDCCGYTW